MNVSPEADAAYMKEKGLSKRPAVIGQEKSREGLCRRKYPNVLAARSARRERNRKRMQWLRLS